MARSGEISLDLVEFLARFGEISPDLVEILAIFGEISKDFGLFFIVQRVLRCSLTRSWLDTARFH